MGIKIGLIGLGNIINCHIDAIKKIDELCIEYVCDSDKGKMEKYMCELNCKGFTDYREMLGHCPDVVLICVPHNLHCSMAIDALKASCHVIIEKPMAVSVGECNEMLKTARETGKQIIVAETAGFQPGAVETGRRYKAGGLGRFFTGSIINERFYFNDERPEWFLNSHMSGGGMFSNIGLHRLAIARACLPGLVPKSVCASVNYVREYEVEACTAAIVKYTEGGSMLYEEVGYFPQPEWLNTGTHFIFEDGIVTWDKKNWYMTTRRGKQYEERLESLGNLYEMVYYNVLCAAQGEEYSPRAWEHGVDVSIAQGAYASSARGTEIRLDSSEWSITG